MEEKIALKKNEKYVVDIIDYGSNGEGVAKIDGCTVFVPFALIGERVEVLIVQAKKDYAFAKILQILSSSKDRQLPSCPYFQKCGGCQLQHIKYCNQLEYKENFIKNCLKKYGNISIDKIDVVGCENHFRYRNKFSFPVAYIDDQLRVGMFRIGSHKFVPIDDCLLQISAKPIIDCFLDYATKFGVEAYNLRTKSGVKHLVCRIFDNNIFLTIVNTKKMQNLDYLYKKLAKFYTKVNISVNINKLENNVIMGNEDYMIFGDKLIIHEFGLDLKVDNHSFVQVNDQIKHKIYSDVLNEISPEDVVVDAYSGAGVLSAIVAQKCKKVYGLEIVSQAVDSANKLAKDNNISNVTNICGDCQETLPKVVKNLEQFVVILDPPRKGCSNNVIDTILSTAPQKIIYISCNPATLARDIALLKDAYTIKKATAYDMFPQTANVETIMILENKRKNNQ